MNKLIKPKVKLEKIKCNQAQIPNIKSHTPNFPKIQQVVDRVFLGSKFFSLKSFNLFIGYEDISNL